MFILQYKYDDLAVLDSVIWVNELNYDSPLDIGTQTWAGERFKMWVATYIPGGDNGITQKITRLPDNFGQLSEIISLYLEVANLSKSTFAPTLIFPSIN